MKFLKKAIAIIILLSIVIVYAIIVRNNSSAYTEEQARIYLGTTSQEAREDYLLGLSSKYAVFLQNDFIISAAETGGKAAVGGSIIGPYLDYGYYQYQIGCGYHDYQTTRKDSLADIIYGGDLRNIATTVGSTVAGTTYPFNKVVVKASDVIDFSEEFEFLNTISHELDNQETLGTVTYVQNAVFTQGEYADKPGIYNAVVLKGENKFVNIFNLTEDEHISNDIIFDVPYNSYVIINIDGSSTNFKRQ